LPVFKPLWVTDPIEYLLLCRFPHLRVYEDDTKRLLGTISVAKKAALAGEAESYRAELEALEDSEIEQRVEAARPIEDERLRLKAIAEEEQRPFNQPYARADFEHWAKMSYWTIDEAVALSLARSPGVASWKAVESLRWKSVFAREFAAKREVAMRAKTMGQLWEQTTPSTFLAWAERMRFPMPAELVEAVKALGIQICDWKSLFDQQKELTDQARREVAEKHAAYMGAMKDHTESMSKSRDHQKEIADGYKGLLDQRDRLIALKDERIQWLETRIAELQSTPAVEPAKSLGAKERDSLLKLVIGMAVGGYGWDPKAARNPTAKEISNDLQLRGIALDEDTVRKYLAEARQLLPGDETEQKG
jgi:hypothetical protein